MPGSDATGRSTEQKPTLLAASLATALVASPILLTATSGGVAAVGIALAGVGVGATFPLTSALHIRASPRTADGAPGQVLGVASIGQIFGPLTWERSHRSPVCAPAC